MSDRVEFQGRKVKRARLGYLPNENPDHTITTHDGVVYKRENGGLKLVGKKKLTKGEKKALKKARR